MFFSPELVRHRKIVSRLSPNAAPAQIPFRDYESYRVYRPAISFDAYPTLIYIPGNAFIASEQDYTHFICTHIVAQSRCQVIMVKHPLAPEHPFPAGLEAAYKTTRLLLSDSVGIKMLKINKSQIAIAGYSSGGNFAALIAIQAKIHKLPIARQILISPVTDLSRSFNGFEEFQDKDRNISEQFVAWFSSLYAPKPTWRFPLVSPRWASDVDLQSLPPTDLIFGELDRFRGDSEVYGQRLIGLGNRVNTVMFKNETHGLLWHNMAVVQTISGRLSVAFGTEPVQRSLSIKMTKEDKQENIKGEKVGIQSVIENAVTKPAVSVFFLKPNFKGRAPFRDIMLEAVAMSPAFNERGARKLGYTCESNAPKGS